MPALHCTCCRVAADHHEASRPEHDDAWGARLSTRTTNRAGLLRWPDGIMSVVPGVNGDSYSNLHAQKQNRALPRNPGAGGKRNLASCQVAVAESWGRSKSRALASCVRPEWSGDADRLATRDGVHAQQEQEQQATGVPMVRGGTRLDGT